MSCTCESYNSYICPQCQPEETKPMKPTLEQLNMLSDYELNCAVAIKADPVLGHAIDEQVTQTTGSAVNFRLSTPTGDCCDAGTYDYCNNPNDYMPIAIEYGIDIKFYNSDTKVRCSKGKFFSSYIPKAQTGRAVCIAFLLINL